ncbi:AcrR family transcriptional regulator [Kibdelosporangium banguiense]|uniref:AcrR family transcriptional regulator n=1 Tax=Kibdelosporangium banguiense TaxID=1365924 RepID=A0ABS4TF05_9PSEU|nr:TetR family transcriptional regulator [Kibdelosporangium banguiense]MBP2322994.1 AcrR family transcriptional regulator [Kibdelosporangium banguiense]
MSGLRERKKRATREALSWAALKLAVDRGVENVLVEEIAAEAGVSPRTFNNYFSSKYEAIVWRELDRMTQIGDALRERPPREPFWEAITKAVLAVYDNDTVPDKSWTSGVREMVNSPLLFGEMLKVHAAMERALAEAIAERVGLDVDKDMYPRVVAGAVGAACGVAQQQWVSADPPMPLGPLVRTALGHLTHLQGGEP